jgi:hypothetical protein
MSHSAPHQGKDRSILLGQFAGEKVNVFTEDKWQCSGTLTKFAFDNSILTDAGLYDKQCLNFQHIVEMSVIR